MMEIKKLEIKHTKEFCGLIKNMYSNLENLEWFSPMPFDYDNVKAMIENPRFYIIGAFDGDNLCAVGSIDYKCGKLIGKIDFPKECNTEKLVELSFAMVHSNYRGNGIMKIMVSHLINKLKNDGYEWAFGKVHKNNLASYKSLIKLGLYEHCDYNKPVKINEFISLSNESFFSSIGKKNAENSLKNIKIGDEYLYVDYKILIKKL